MKTEGEFNAFLSKEFKKHEGILAIKTADKYRAGISDFILCVDGHMVCIESKFSTVEPKTSTQKILKHDFAPEQKTFLKRACTAGASTFGLVACKSTKLMYLLREGVLDLTMNVENIRMYSVAFDLTPVGVLNMLSYIRRRIHGQP